MNSTLKSVFANCGFLMLATFAKAQVGIGTTSPDASARLQVDANASTNAKGFLPPRVALQGTNDAQLTSPSTPTIANPATGLLVYNTVNAGSGATAVTPGFYYYSGSAWVRLSTGVSTVGSIAGASNANGATISGNTINLTPADATNGGIVTTSSQSFSGAKAFTSNLSVNGITIGRSPGGSNTNTVLGSAALGNNTSGTFNTAVGGSTLFYNTIGSHNFAGGQGALEQSVSGTNNVAIGSSALQNNVSGHDNSAFGVGALLSNTTGEKNTAVGVGANVSANNLTNATALGFGATVAASNSVQLGNSSVTNVKTSGTLTAGVVTYPNTDGTANQVLTTNGSGVVSWSTPSAGVTSMGTIAVSSNANGATISGTTISLTPADGTHGGIVTNGTQTFSGAKTLSNTTASTSTTTGALVVSGGVGIAGNTNVGGALNGSNTASSTISGFAANINNQTGTTYQLAASDNGKIITLNNANAITLTVPSGLLVGFNCMIVQLGSGQVTIVAGNGATVTNRNSYSKTGGQNAIMTLISVASNSFISSGDMSN